MSDLDPPQSLSIQGIRSVTNRIKHFPDTLRDTFLTRFQNVRLTGRSIHYPNCLLQVGSSLINPYDERVMSLQKDSFYDDDQWTPPLQHSIKKHFTEPVYFFIYNVDNYYHFVYDTLPILYGYLFLKREHPSLHLLIQTSHPTKQALPPFVIELLAACGITNLLFASKDTLYEKVYVGTSLTHGRHSNLLPSPKAYEIWNQITYPPHSLPKRFYVSRRSWTHGQTHNLGTNYTMRRQCVNETELVNLLKEYGIIEIFTECLTTDMKLAMFAQADIVVGVIGGGMCNLLFSPHTTRSVCIVTPTFLDVNERFRHSMDHTQSTYLHSTTHIPSPLLYTLYTRVKVVNLESPVYGHVGEIEEHLRGAYCVRMSSNDVAGFSQDFTMEARVLHEWELEPLDRGLNSPYHCKLAEVEAHLIRLGLTREANCMEEGLNETS